MGIKKYFDFLRDVYARNWESYHDWQFKKRIAGKGCIHRDACILKDPWCELSLGEGSTIESGTVVVCRNNEASPGVENSTVRIGRHSYIGQYCNLRTGGGSIEIGDNVLMAQFVSLIASGHGVSAGVPIREQKISLKHGIKIGDGSWIGVSAIVLPGVTIGAGAVVGAGSVVTRDVPPNAIVVGNPARILKYRE